MPNIIYTKKARKSIGSLKAVNRAERKRLGKQGKKNPTLTIKTSEFLVFLLCFLLTYKSYMCNINLWTIPDKFFCFKSYICSIYFETYRYMGFRTAEWRKI